MRQPWQTFALVGCANRSEFEANAAALDITLPAEELAWLETGGNMPF
jgi:aryl-alcohol dehydrogenase-like predicted oxidoreductase